MQSDRNARRRLRRQHACCARKRAYLSELLAVNMATLLAIQFPRRRPLVAYRCPVCPDWHLTSHPRP